MLYTFWFHNLVVNRQLLPRAVNKCSLNYLTFSVEQKIRLPVEMDGLKV